MRVNPITWYVAFCTRYWYVCALAIIIASIPFWFGKGTGSKQLDLLTGCVYGIVFFGAVLGTANALQKRKSS